MDPVTGRMVDLERRVRALEIALPAYSLSPPLPVLSRTNAQGVVLTAAGPAPSRTRDVPRPALRTHSLPRGDFESWLGGVLLARVGIGAVVLAAAYFAQLAYRHVPDLGKVASLYALAGALLVAGRLLRSRAAQRFAALLQGGAVAVAYVAGLAASLRYGLVGPEVGCVLLAAAAALGALLARRSQIEALAAVSVLGAMAAPHLLGLTREPHIVVLLFAAAISTWAAWAHARWGWIATRCTALVGAVWLGWAWFAWAGSADGRALRIEGLHLYTLVLLAPGWLAAWRGSGPARSVRGLGLGAIGILVAVLALLELLVLDGHSARLAGRTLLSGALWLGLVGALGVARRDRDGVAFVRGWAFLGGVALVLGVVLAWEVSGESLQRLIALGLLTPTLLLLRARVQVGEIAAMLGGIMAWGTVGHEAWLIASAAPDALGTGTALALLPLALGPAAVLVLWGRSTSTIGTGTILGALTLFTAFARQAQVVPVWWAAAVGAGAAWLALVALAARVRREPWSAVFASSMLALLAFVWTLVGLVRGRTPGWEAPWDPHTLSALLVGLGALGVRAHLMRASLLEGEGASLLGASALGLLVLAGGREVQLASCGLEGAWAPVLLSVYATLAAAGLLALGFVRDARGLRLAALLLFAGVIVKVGVHDLAAAALELRLLVTLVLGLVLLASAYAYTRARAEAPPQPIRDEPLPSPP